MSITSSDPRARQTGIRPSQRVVCPLQDSLAYVLTLPSGAMASHVVVDDTWGHPSLSFESEMLLLLKYEQGCPAKDRPLSAKDGRLSVWHADQMM